jgi:general stress protein 26
MAKKVTQAGEAKANGSLKKLRKLMKDIRVGMLTTVDREGRLHSRPMMTSDVQFDGDLWFIARATSGLADHIGTNPHVNVAYADPKGDEYVSVSGLASLVRDDTRLKELWSGRHKAWFPEGKKDPDLTLLKVNVEGAEYWDARSDAVELAQFVKSHPLGVSAEEPTGAGAQG